MDEGGFLILTAQGCAYAPGEAPVAAPEGESPKKRSGRRPITRHLGFLWAVGMLAMLWPMAFWTFHDGSPVFWPPLLLAGLVVGPEHVALTSEIIGVAIWLVCLVVFLHREPRVSVRRGLRLLWGILWRLVMGLATLFTALCMALTTLMTGHSLSLWTYHVVSPRSQQGCEVVITAQVLATHSPNYGAILVTRPRSLILRSTHEIWRGEGDPIVDGNWSLSWVGSVGSLRIGEQIITVVCAG